MTDMIKDGGPAFPPQYTPEVRALAALISDELAAGSDVWQIAQAVQSHTSKANDGGNK